MQLALISARSLRKVSDQELLSLHHRVHQLWGLYFEHTHDESAGNLTREDLFNIHELIKAEMERRKMHHNEDSIDHAIKSHQDLMVVPSFVSIVGSTVRDPEHANDLDVVIRSEFDEKGNKFYISWENIYLPLRNVLDPEKTGKLHIILNPTGPHGDYIPVYDLVLRPAKQEDVVKVQFHGTGAQGSARKATAVAVSCSEEEIVISDPTSPTVSGNSSKLLLEQHDEGCKISTPVGIISYAPSISHLPEWVKGSDLLIADGFAWDWPIKTEIEHQPILDTIAQAKELGVKRTIFVNVGPDTEYAIKSGEVEKEGVEIASDGQEIELKAVRPGSIYVVMKPKMAGVTDTFSIDELWEDWVKEKLNHGIYASTKIDGFRTIIGWDGEEWYFWFEDSKKRRKFEIPKPDAPSFVIEGEFTATKDNKWLARTELAGVVAGNTEADPFFWLYDLLYYDDQDVSAKPFAERLKILQELGKKLGKNFKVLDQYLIKDKSDLNHVLEIARKTEVCEGIYVRQADAPYAFGPTDTSAKLKFVAELKVQVIEAIKKTNGYVYHVGLRGGDETDFTNVKDGLLDLGNTFVSPNQYVSPGDTLNVTCEELVIGESNGKKVLFWGKPTVLGPDKSRPAYTVAQALDIASRSKILKIEHSVKSIEPREDETRADIAASFWKNNWYQMYPKSGKGEFVLHYHFRGLSQEETAMSLEELLETDNSLHADLRFCYGPALFGFTVFTGTTGDVRKAGGNRIANLPEDDALQGTWKLQQPLGWLTVARKKPYISVPGGVGSTSRAYAKFFEVDHGTYEIGVWREHFFEFFLHGRDLKGRYIIAYAPMDGHRVWLISKPASQEPYAKTHKKEDVIAELKAKGQKYLIWSEPGKKPELIELEG